jgi:L-fuculose-phosphate aldolase
MINEWKIREEICQVGKRLYDKNYVVANDGNISVRLGRGRYICTPTGVSKGSMKPADLAIVDDTGKQISGPKPRTSEVKLHLEIYHEMPQVNAVVHAHPPHATAFAVAGMEIPVGILPEVEFFIGQVPIAKYDTPGSKDFAETILPHLRNKCNTILLANHGAVACDSTLEQAYFHLETLDQYCLILLYARQIGRVNVLEEPKVRELLDIKKRMGLADPRFDDSGAVSCALTGSDEFLRGYSERAIAQHRADASGCGRGQGNAGAAREAGRPQPLPSAGAGGGHSATIEKLVSGMLGSSSQTFQKRVLDDEVERMTQIITDRIVQMMGQK